MTATAKRIEEEIRQLPLEDMLHLHEQLVASIHEKEGDQQLDPAFRADIERRIREIDTGGAKGAEAFSALKKM